MKSSLHVYRDGMIEKVNLKEDHTGIFTVVQFVDDIRKESPSHLQDRIARDKIWILKYTDEDKVVFRVTQSPWKDGSGLDYGLGIHDTIGDAIMHALQQAHRGYRVYHNDKQILPVTNPIIVAGIAGTDPDLYTTKE